MVDAFIRNTKLNLLKVMLTVGSIVGALIKNTENLFFGLSSYEVLSIFLIMSLLYHIIIISNKKQLKEENGEKAMRWTCRGLTLILSTTFTILITQFLKNTMPFVLAKIFLVILLYVALLYKFEK